MQTILILDDDETIGDLAQEVLTRAGYRNLRPTPGRRRCCFSRRSSRTRSYWT